MLNLQEMYQKEIKPKLQEELSISNPMAVPKLVKIVINVGLGEALKNRKVLDEVAEQLALISGQKPQITRAKRAISSFKLRAGEAIGLKVTLRGRQMYDFFAKLVRVVLPRMRDFRGIPLKRLDGQGNITLGFSEQIVFPEIEYAKVDKIRGLEIVIVTSAKTNSQARRLLELLGMPFKKMGNNK